MASIPKIEQLFDESEPGDWRFFEAEFGLVDDDRHIYPTWVYEHDTDLRIEQGRVAVDDFKEEWAEKVPDTEHNQSHAYWLVYGRSPIEQHIVVSVDGGRADIPVPNRPTDKDDDWTITPKEHKLGGIISRNYQEYERCLNLCGIEVVDQ